MELPKKISPNPIVDSLVEVRFTPSIHSNAVFGLIYNVLKNDFKQVESLPILQLPDVVRTEDPNFRYKPHYRISDNDFIIQIGPDVLSISSYPNYSGWNTFSKTIFNVLNKLESLEIVHKIERIGIRYVNFFENDIFDKINLNVSIDSNIVFNKNTVVKTEIDQGDYKSTLQIANNAIKEGIAGSIIDIDTFMNTNLDSFFEKKTEIINIGHTNLKKSFFGLLKPDFLKSLNPEY